MTTQDKRRHSRSQFFLLHKDGQALPVYAFRDELDVVAIPALLLDMGAGGVQVLTTADDAPVAGTYELEVRHSELLDAEMPRVRIVKAWQRQDGINVRTGFAFSDCQEVQNLLGKCLAASEHHLLRCVLHPSE